MKELLLYPSSSVIPPLDFLMAFEYGLPGTDTSFMTTFDTMIVDSVHYGLYIFLLDDY